MGSRPNATRAAQIVHKQEALALCLLERAAGKKINIDVQMDVFDRIAKWVAIKNKLENDDGGGIADYKRALAGEADKRPPRRSWSRKGQPSGGARLDEIKSRIPGADDGGDDGDSGAAGGEVSAAAGGAGSLHFGLIDGGKP